MSLACLGLLMVFTWAEETMLLTAQAMLLAGLAGIMLGRVRTTGPARLRHIAGR